MTTPPGNSAASGELINPDIGPPPEAITMMVRDQEREGASAETQPPEPKQRIDVFARFRQGALATCSTTSSGKSWSKLTRLNVRLSNDRPSSDRLSNDFHFQVVGFNPKRIDVFPSRHGVIGHGSWEDHGSLGGERWKSHENTPNIVPGWYNDSNSLVSFSPVVVQLPFHVFVLFYVHGVTRDMWYCFGNYGRMDWSDWACLGGNCNSKPVAISRSRNIIDLFFVDLDGGLYWNSWTDMAWKPEFEKLGNGCKGDPEAVALHRGRIDLFVVGARGELRSKVWNGKGWEPSGLAWLALGGSFASRPAIVARDAKRFDLFIIGVDGKLYHKALDNSIWKPAIGFRNLGGSFSTEIPPTAVFTKSGIHVFLVGGAGASGGAYHKCWDGVDEKTPWEFEQFFGWNCSTPISAVVRDIGG